ncbi:centromere protein H [Flavobacterium sp. LS1R49]|uniref:Centromere protein H n=1 Tax=Flavobacterium shii TaxID=2987687 RepID=A0A9X3C4N5_9FLAO|nr:centromere protein H [Flavobacterium shii]MCV9928319.1 centromere protein H [Flavobacterium shii]
MKPSFTLLFSGIFILSSITIKAQISTSTGGSGSVLPNSPTSNSNVGIGTTNPSFYQHGGNNKILEISNPNVIINSQSHIVISSGSVQPSTSIGSLTWALPNTTSLNKGVAYLGVVTAPNSTSSNPSSSILFATRNATSDNWKEQMIIANTGNVGIGTLAPTAILDVNLPLPTTGRYSSQKWSTINPEYNLTLQTIWNTGGINQEFIQRFNGVDYTSLAFFQGNVGIGTTNPTAKLTVAGDINAREVRVTVNAGADFVFENEYNLPSLTTVETYIKENKHLPEIASAKEMQESGINLSEMNIKLLQKVEELTLYTIEQHKENTVQSKKTEELALYLIQQNKDMEELKAQMKKVLENK